MVHGLHSTPKKTPPWYEQVTPLFVHGQFSPLNIFEQIPASRPKRIAVDHPHHFSWRGYIDGSYMMSDYKACPTQACIKITNTPVYWRYMLQAWRPILLDDNAQTSNTITIPDALIATASQEPANTEAITQTSYSVNQVSYQVNLRTPRFMVENETYFPGWQGVIRLGNQTISIQAAEVNGAFRGWRLPAGNYQLVTRFSFPHLTLFVEISLASTALWLVVAGSLSVERKANRKCIK